MKFFYVNNSLCEGCDDCSVVCPVDAVYTAGGKRYIAHDKCTSCGSCIRTCGYNAVSMESIDGMVERMENADLYLSRIRRLEKELAQVNDRLEETLADLSSVLESSPTAMALCTPSGKVTESNSLFRNLTGGKKDITDLPDILPAGTVKVLLGDTEAGTAVTCQIGERSFYIQAAGLSAGRMLCIFDDLSDGKIASARIAGALRRAVDRKMEMVQKIGTILGDEASSTLNDINEALRLVEHSTRSDKENDPGETTGSILP